MSVIDLMTLAALLGCSRIQLVLRYPHATARHPIEAMPPLAMRRHTWPTTMSKSLGKVAIAAQRQLGQIWGSSLCSISSGSRSALILEFRQPLACAQ